MPIYQFIVHGQDPDDPERHGFYTTRHAHATEQRTAEALVLASLAKEFTTGVSADHWAAGPPLLTVEKARRIGWLTALRAPNRGSTFYREEAAGDTH